MTDDIRIDGAYGEGGGQLVRNTIALSCVTGRPVTIDNIRHKRKNPGLRPQHAAAIRILAEMCGAKTDGVAVGSRSVRFAPGRMTGDSSGAYNLTHDIGTAGSITLVLQMLVPAVAGAGASLSLDIKGGTDVRWSPTTEYMKTTACTAYARMGISCAITKKRCGYYPKGGGRITAEISRKDKIAGMTLTGARPSEATLYCSYSGVNRDRIDSRLTALRQALDRHGIEYDEEVTECDSVQPGAAVAVCGINDNAIIGYDAIFDPRTQDAPAGPADEFADAREGVDTHLADMMVLPAAMANDITVFRTRQITDHLKTGLYIASEMTGCRYGIGETGGGFEVRIDGSSDARV